MSTVRDRHEVITSQGVFFAQSFDGVIDLHSVKNTIEEEGYVLLTQSELTELIRTEDAIRARCPRSCVSDDGQNAVLMNPSGYPGDIRPLTSARTGGCRVICKAKQI